MPRRPVRQRLLPLPRRPVQNPLILRLTLLKWLRPRIRLVRLSRLTWLPRLTLLLRISRQRLSLPLLIRLRQRPLPERRRVKRHRPGRQPLLRRHARLLRSVTEW